MLETRNIYLDTQVFVQHNYFCSWILQEVIEFASIAKVNLFTTNITLSEIRSNLKEDLQKMASEVQKFNRGIGGTGKILKNFPGIPIYAELPAFNVENPFADLCKQLDSWLEHGNVTILPYHTIDLTTVMNGYFNAVPPFSGGKKKHEFPDAIVIQTIEEWCAANNQKMYFVSGDKDFSGIHSTHIIKQPSIEVLLDAINKQDNADRHALASKAYQYNQAAITEKIQERFSEKLKDEIGYDIFISQVNVTKTHLIDFNITDVSDLFETTVQVAAQIEYLLTVDYNDYSMSYYDKEDDRYYGYESRTRTVEREDRISADITLEIDELSQQPEADSRIECIDVTIPSDSDITDDLPGYLFVM